MRTNGLNTYFSQKMPKQEDFSESNVSYENESQKRFLRHRKKKSRPKTGNKLFSMDILKLGELSLPCKFHRARGAMAVLGDDDLRGVVQGLIIDLRSVE